MNLYALTKFRYLNISSLKKQKKPTLKTKQWHGKDKLNNYIANHSFKYFRYIIH